MQTCECGCGRQVKTAGARYVRGHGLKRRWEDYPPPVRDPESGCLRWQGPHHSGGYGKIGGKQYAHLVAFEREVGPIPFGHQVDHVAERGCRWKDCVEPTHLEAVTQAENIRRQPITIQRKARTHCPQGHEYSGHNLIIRRGCRECRACTYNRNARNRKARQERQRASKA